VFDLVVNGDLTPSIGRRYDLADAPQARHDLASHRTTGKLLLPGRPLTGEGR
jgi:NADPH:quinone reductase-like Zn-dependent oxidoreductase